MGERAPTVTLLTDFGPKDPFIGIMKGVMASLAPGTIVIDLCHAVAPYDIVEAGFLLASSYSYFPQGTIHVAVVDPGVGTGRQILAIEAKGYFFVVPDNGLIVPTLAGPQEANRIASIQNEAYFLKPVSATFHGRDIFASVAAHLSKGVPLAAFGPAVREFQRGPFPDVVERALPDGRRVLEGEIIHVDAFGNLISSIRIPAGAAVAAVSCGDRRVGRFARTYGETAPGEPLSLIGSSGFLEIAVNRGSASEALGVGRGEKIHVEVTGTPKK